MTTNLKAAFDKVLEIALESHISMQDMPRAIIVRGVLSRQANTC